MRTRTRSVLRWMLVLLVALAGLGCSRTKETVADPTFQNDLVRELGAAKEVRITEHSSPYDWKRKGTREYLYREKILSPESKAKLIKQLADMDPVQSEAMSACVPLFHHRIEFPGTNVAPVEICFHCGHLGWMGTKGRHPVAIFQVLGDFLESEGFEKSRDWDALAEEAEKSAAP